MWGCTWHWEKFSFSTLCTRTIAIFSNVIWEMQRNRDQSSKRSVIIHAQTSVFSGVMCSRNVWQPNKLSELCCSEQQSWCSDRVYDTEGTYNTYPALRRFGYFETNESSFQHKNNSRRSANNAFFALHGIQRPTTDALLQARIRPVVKWDEGVVVRTCYARHRHHARYPPPPPPHQRSPSFPVLSRWTLRARGSEYVNKIWYFNNRTLCFIRRRWTNRVNKLPTIFYWAMSFVRLQLCHRSNQTITRRLIVLLSITILILR